MDQPTDEEYYEGNMEFGAYQENVPVGYADGGTMSMNVVDWVDETTLYPQSIFTAPEGVFSDHQWSFPHTLSSYDGEAGPQLPQTHYAPPTPNVNPITTSIPNFQNSANYASIHHLDH